MFHAVIMVIATCFGCTLYYFYAFSGTNLLTRCQSASSVFSAVFGFRNPTQKISSKSGEIFSSVNTSSGSFRSPKTTWGEPRGAHTPLGRGLGWGRAQLGCGGPGWPPAPILRLYIPLDAKTLIRKTIFHKKFRRGRHRQSQIGGVLTFFLAPAGGEIITGGFYIIMPASGVMRE